MSENKEITASKLIVWLLDAIENHGNIPVDIITETDKGQVEQPVGDIAVSAYKKRIKILPKDF